MFVNMTGWMLLFGVFLPATFAYYYPPASPSLISLALASSTTRSFLLTAVTKNTTMTLMFYKQLFLLASAN